MKKTTFYPNKKQRSHLATPYIKDQQTGTLTAAPYAAFGAKGQPPFGNGGLFSTGPDYARFCQMLLNGGILKASAISALPPFNSSPPCTPVNSKRASCKPTNMETAG